MIDFLIGLIATAASATAWLAYSHPQEFKSKLPLLMGIPLLFCVGLFIWMAAIKWAEHIASVVLDGAVYSKMRTALEGGEPPALALFMAVPAIVVFFAVLDLWVSKIKDKEPK